MSAPPKVALLVETARGFDRSLLHGIARYSALHGNWDFILRPGDFEQFVPKIQRWGCTGIIARIANDRIARHVLKCGLPTIALGLYDKQWRPGSSLANLINVGSKPTQIAGVAVDYFADRCFSHFAYVGVPDHVWSIRRKIEYRRILRKRGAVAHTFIQPKSKRKRQWDYEQILMAHWISQLPKPVGLFACNDDRGRQVLEACMLAGARVPEEVAVLGVDNDTMVCNLAQPTLSSIAINAEIVGYRAAKLLDDMMQRKDVSQKQIDIETVGVISRCSTDVVAVNDAGFSKAIRFIRENRGTTITVAEVVEVSGVSRNELEGKFCEFLKRSIFDEIRNARFHESKRLLLDTSLSTMRVAQLAGFKTSAYFCQFFRQKLGMTPRQFRSEFAQ